MKVFTRVRNSGSEGEFRTLVMGGLEPADFLVDPTPKMIQVIDDVVYDKNAICYTFNNYKDCIVRAPDNVMPKIAINGIFPDNETVKNRVYPFISEVHVAIRSDLDHNSMAYKLYEWLQTANINPILTACGFIPK